MAVRKTTKTRRTTKATTKTVKRQKPVEEMSVTAPVETSRSTRPVRSRNWRYLLIPLFIISLALSAFYLYKTLFPVAIVNGEPITRNVYVSEMEKQSGKQIINSLVTKSLITQEAKKQKITVGQNEINDELKKYESALKQQGQTLDAALKQQGLTRKDLEEQVVIQKKIEKILGKEIQVSDKDVNDYIAKNSSTMPEGADTKEMRDSVKQQLQQQKLSEKFQTWLADLQKKAKINYYTAY